MAFCSVLMFADVELVEGAVYEMEEQTGNSQMVLGESDFGVVLILMFWLSSSR